MGKRGTEGRAIKIIFPTWINEAIEKLTIEYKCTYKDIVVKFCELELNAMNIYMGIGREPQPTENQNFQKTDIP